MWTRDPFHRLSNAFVNALKAVVPVFESVLRLIVVGKFRRAPFGRGKFWNELKSAVSILVESTKGDSPVIDHFFADICADYGEAAHGVSQAGMCDFLTRMVVHGIGPGCRGPREAPPARRAPGPTPAPCGGGGRRLPPCSGHVDLNAGLSVKSPVYRKGPSSSYLWNCP